MFNPPYPACDPTDKNGFSYETVVKRWPVIITGIIDHLYQINHGLSLKPAQCIAFDMSSLDQEGIHDIINESKAIMGKIARLRYEMGRDYKMPMIDDDGEAMVEEYNKELARLAEQGKGTWFTCPWLYAECYLYRLIRSYFKLTKLWSSYDPFQGQKDDTFKKSGNAVFKIATTMSELESTREVFQNDPEKLKVLFKEMIQMCLWGNATDLSLLTHMSTQDIENLQSVGKEAQEARKEFILKDDQDAAWKHLSSLKEARVDIVLDNSGFELFTDLVFADFLVTYTPYVSKVVFHPKSIPWFVSDVTPPDFQRTIHSLLDPSIFNHATSSDSASWRSDLSVQPAEISHFEALAARWRSYLSNGTFALSVPLTTPLGASDPMLDFWTSPWPYWDMMEEDGRPRPSGGRTVWEWLRGSGLVVFKGDLNYRKLTGDLKWPASTPFTTAIGPLAGTIPILSLRTNKADVVVGIDQNVADKLDASGEKWRVNGRYALVSFCEMARD